MRSSLHVAALAAMLGCTAQPSRPPPPSEPPTPGGPSEPGPARTPSDSTSGRAARTASADCAPPPGTPDPAVDRAVRTIVGGRFSVDHLGPDAVATLEDHVAREPDAFLDQWARLALDPEGSLELYWTNLLTRTAALRPDRTKRLARCLLKRFDEAIAEAAAAPDPEVGIRLANRQRTLYLQWTGRASDRSWRLAEATRACRDGARLTVEVGCTCGETVVCEATEDAQGPDVFVVLDLESGGTCRDCYPGTGTCSLAALSKTTPLTVNGRSLPISACPLP